MIYNNLFYNTQMGSTRQMPGIANIRVFHAVIDASPIDAYANGKLIARNLAYGQFTNYISLPMNTYNFELYPAGQKNTPLISVSFPIEGSKVYTIAAIGTLQSIGILPVEDVYEPISPDRVNIRFANLSPNAPSLDLITRSGEMIFSNINFTQVSNYRSLPPGPYQFFIRQSMTTTNVLYLPVRLLPRRNLTFYLIGAYGQEPSNLRVHIPLDGTTYLRDY